MSGIEAMKTYGVAGAAFSVASPESTWAAKVVTGVIVDSLPVQASLAPSRTVTYCAPCAAALAAWPARADIFAPVFASLYAVTGPSRCSRARWLFTDVVLPVLHDRLGQSTYQPQALKPRVIESPRAAIECGTGGAAAWAGAAGPTTARASRTATRAWTRRTVRMRTTTSPLRVNRTDPAAARDRMPGAVRPAESYKSSCTTVG